jgi:hypothetical protein
MLSAIMVALTLGMPGPRLRSYRHPVAIWVAPYAVAKSESQLSKPGIASAITHLSLQFWVPTPDGRAELTKSSPEVTESAVARLRTWAHARGIRAMLCVFNGAQDWDWPLAKAGFASHPQLFVSSLVREMERFDLDGIDVDLEGPAEYESDKPAFVAFLAELSREVHARHKQLSVASFCGKWNAPKRTWWPDMFPLVDTLTSMGYENAGMKAGGGNDYASQQQAAGKFAGRLQIGVPSSRDAWQGNSSAEQLGWIATSGRSGIGIWDAQLRAASWQSPELWKIVRRISGGGPRR